MTSEVFCLKGKEQDASWSPKQAKRLGLDVGSRKNVKCSGGRIAFARKRQFSMDENVKRQSEK